MISSIKNAFFRILRLLGALAVIYASMIFYLALTERQLAFPRAITHKEANQAIQDKAKQLSCTLEDGTILGGWQLGDDPNPTLLYYPDTDEDAAQFIAEVGSVENITIVSFNYRGSGTNKGTPSSENFENDAEQIFECAAQVNSASPTFIVGRRIGAILAAQQHKIKQESSKLILIDPIYSIADKIEEKYHILYPKFLIRTKVKIPNLQEFQNRKNIVIIKDKKQNESATSRLLQGFAPNGIIQADGASINNKLKTAIQRFTNKGE